MRQVLRLLRGSLYSRQGAQPYFLLRSRRSAATGGPWLYGDSTPRPERELLPRSRWKEELCRSAGGGGFGRWIRRVRFTTSHPRDFGRDIVEVIDAVPAL